MVMYPLDVDLAQPPRSVVGRADHVALLRLLVFLLTLPMTRPSAWQ